MTTLLATMTARGLVHDATPGLEARLKQGAITGYVGFDPTADSLHVGHLLPVMALAWLQRCGGRPIALVGGGTGMVGDPSGRREERPVLSVEVIDRNAHALRDQLARFLDFEGPSAARVMNNADWLRRIGLMEFLRDTGKHFTLNYMLQKESVKSRMETGISFTEFTYLLVQAYDFWHLHQAVQCELQMGGSDQWGNITAGIELIGRRAQAQAHGLVVPLLTTAAGTKFGKSEGESVWLDPARTSPYRFYQFWLNTDDRDVERLLNFFTFLPADRIASAMAELTADPGRRAAHRILAEDITTRVHGADTTKRVIAASAILFGGTDLRGADAGVFEVLAGEVPTTTLPRGALDGGLALVDALVQAGLASSKADARRGIEGKGFAVNGEKSGEVDRRITSADVLAGGFVMLQKGKKNYGLLRIN